MPEVAEDKAAKTEISNEERERQKERQEKLKKANKISNSNTVNEDTEDAAWKLPLLGNLHNHTYFSYIANEIRTR